MNLAGKKSSLPADFRRALRREGMLKFFTECAYVHRAGYLGWLTEAGQSASRRRRITEAVARLRARRAEVLAMVGPAAAANATQAKSLR